MGEIVKGIAALLIITFWVGKRFYHMAYNMLGGYRQLLNQLRQVQNQTRGGWDPQNLASFRIGILGITAKLPTRNGVICLGLRT